MFFSCNRILTRRCAKRFQPVGLKHLPWQPLVIDEQQKQNSIEGWEGSQILSATLPLIYMTDIKGTEDRWPPATWLSSKAVHHFIQEQVQMIRANMCFARRAWQYLSSQNVCHACMRVMECKQSIRQEGVFDIRPETGGLSGCRVFLFCFFASPPTAQHQQNIQSPIQLWGRVFPDVTTAAAAAAMALCKWAQPTDYPDGHMMRSAGLKAHIQTQTDSGLATGFAE